MTPLDSLRANLIQTFSLPDAAVEWLLMLFQAIQVFDDVADDDPVNRDDLDTAIWNTLVAMPQNPFFITNWQHLLPLVASSFLKWKASDEAERSGRANEKSFMWRSGYYEIILMVISLCHGPRYAIDHAEAALNLYGENYQDYLKEFRNA